MKPRIIAHLIEKNRNSNEIIQIDRGLSLLVADDFTTKFLEDLRHGITQRNPSSGRFKKSAKVKEPFQTRLLDYLKTPSDKAFIELSVDLTDRLAEKMKKQQMATGGYVVFAEHRHGDENLFLVILLSHKAKPSFNKALQLTASDILDLEHLRHATRIHESQVESNEDGNVKFVSREFKGTADYFLDFLGVEAVGDSAKQGKMLTAALTVACEELKLDPDHAREVTHAYWKKCKKEKVQMELTALANLILPGRPQDLLKALGDERFGLAGEFDPPPARIMNDLVKFSCTSHGLTLRFERSTWLDRVKIDGKNIKIKNAPEELLQEIYNAQNPREDDE